MNTFINDIDTLIDRINKIKELLNVSESNLKGLKEDIINFNNLSSCNLLKHSETDSIKELFKMHIDNIKESHNDSLDSLSNVHNETIAIIKELLKLSIKDIANDKFNNVKAEIIDNHIWKEVSDD